MINLWEVEAELVFQQPLPSLLPFVPVLRGGSEESAGLELLPEIRKIEDVELLGEISEAIKTVDTLDALRQIYRTS